MQPVKYDQSLSPKDRYVLRVHESVLVANFDPEKTVPPMAESENLLWRQTASIVELCRERASYPPDTLVVFDPEDMKALRAGPVLLQEKLRQAKLSP